MPKESGKSATAKRRHRTLTRQMVINAALNQLQGREGKDLSMRELARDLEVTPMALYRHVANKEELLDEVRRSVLSLMPLVEAAKPAVRVERALSEGEIVEKALSMVEIAGTAGLNMRKLAAQLGVTPMSIYRHVPNKEALLSKMVDAILAGLIACMPATDSWEADFREHARAVWRRFSAYPGLVGSFATGPSPITLEHMALERALFRRAGLSDQAASIAVTTYHTFMLGLFRTQAYLALLARSNGTRTGVSAERIRRFGNRLPLNELLEFHVDALIAGVRQSA
jgi:AcrR family transcriptional regulator